MKKIIFGIMILTMCFCIVACGTEVPNQPSDTTAQPTPEATEEPEIIAMVTDTENAEIFAAGVNTVFPEAELQQSLLADFRGENVAAVVAYLTEENADTTELTKVIENGGVVVVFDMTGGNHIPGAINLAYEAQGAQEKMLETALTYDLHDTPVRMFGMFTGQESEAYTLWAANYDAGKIFPKGVYLENESEEDAKTWLSEKLAGYYPGMLDAIYVENETLALAAAEVMESLGRDDAEIFVCNASEQWLGKMQQTPRLFGATVGANPGYAGAYTANAVEKALNGETVSDMQFTPHVLYAADIAQGIEGFFTEDMTTDYPM